MIWGRVGVVNNENLESVQACEVQVSEKLNSSQTLLLQSCVNISMSQTRGQSILDVWATSNCPDVS